MSDDDHPLVDVLKRVTALRNAHYTLTFSHDEAVRVLHALKDARIQETWISREEQRLIEVLITRIENSRPDKK